MNINLNGYILEISELQRVLFKHSLESDCNRQDWWESVTCTCGKLFDVNVFGNDFDDNLIEGEFGFTFYPIRKDMSTDAENWISYKELDINYKELVSKVTPLKVYTVRNTQGLVCLLSDYSLKKAVEQVEDKVCDIFDIDKRDMVVTQCVFDRVFDGKKAIEYLLECHSLIPQIIHDFERVERVKYA